MEKWQNSDTLLIWVVIIIGVMILLVGTLIGVFYISYKKVLRSKDEELKAKMEYQRSLLKVSLEAQENERMRIAADLHDNIISKLTIIRLKAVMGSRLQELDQLLGTAIDESRRISHELLPPLYEEKSLDDILLTVFKSWIKVYSIKHTIDVRTEKLIDKSIKLQTVRILQELLNNIHKHAKATHIHLMLRITDYCVVMLVKDNGMGFDTNCIRKGIGLKNIDSRAENLHAQYKYKSVKEKGTRFILFVTHGEDKTSIIR
ncbi:sensor histidine kinase [Paenimyroides aestuarii]|uniref:histidine kinase n=1 Tax=Paenimyroides aestuarii TaxID=2968490 RepID=A0ABY5NP37_9FLAO|nr:ATP-binding protein [Paenimyroides aestuarii]UUV20189.1 histidine kinase [Paenimyroides aestuarii]